MTPERPAVDFAAYRAAELLGGSPKDHVNLTIAVWAMMHGMALLQISGSMRKEDHPRAMLAFKKAIAVLIENEDQLRAGVEKDTFAGA
jgi:hypothetical protein